MRTSHDDVTDALRKFREARRIEAEALQVLIEAAVTPEGSTSREFLSITEVADLTGLAEQTIRNCITRGDLRLSEHYHKPTGGRLIFEADAVRRWIRQRRDDLLPLEAVGGARRAR